MKKKILFFIILVFAVVLNEHIADGMIEYSLDRKEADIKNVTDMFVMFDEVMYTTSTGGKDLDEATSSAENGRDEEIPEEEEEKEEEAERSPMLEYYQYKRESWKKSSISKSAKRQTREWHKLMKETLGKMFNDEVETFAARIKYKCAEPPNKRTCALLALYLAKIGWLFPINEIMAVLNCKLKSRSQELEKIGLRFEIIIQELGQSLSSLTRTVCFMTRIKNLIALEKGDIQELGVSTGLSIKPTKTLEKIFSAFLFKDKVASPTDETEFNMNNHIIYEVEVIWNLPAEENKTRISSILQFIEAEKGKVLGLREVNVDQAKPRRPKMSSNRELSTVVCDGQIPRFCVVEKNEEKTTQQEHDIA